MAYHMLRSVPLATAALAGPHLNLRRCVVRELAVPAEAAALDEVEAGARVTTGGIIAAIAIVAAAATTTRTHVGVTAHVAAVTPAELPVAALRLARI